MIGWENKAKLYFSFIFHFILEKIENIGQRVTVGSYSEFEKQNAIKGTDSNDILKKKKTEEIMGKFACYFSCWEWARIRKFRTCIFLKIKLITTTSTPFIRWIHFEHCLSTEEYGFNLGSIQNEQIFWMIGLIINQAHS